MELYSSNENYKLYEGNMLDMLEVIEFNSIDSIITDPPYELNFMNKGWDNSGIAFQKETWQKCYEVLKPGGYLLAFGGTRTFHRIACAIEDAGFEIRDTIMWLYGSGFPKSMNIGPAIDKKNDSEETKRWAGWGTALKPAYEPIIVARKPYKGSCVDNILKYDVGGLNIDECRVPSKPGEYDIRHYTQEDCFQNLKPKQSHYQVKPQPEGRFPANVIFTYDDTDKEDVCGGFPNSDNGNNDSAARYFYCAKASKRDRDEGLDAFPDKFYGQSGGAQAAIARGESYSKGSGFNTAKVRKNTHPTVKPTSLMQYLVRLVTPKGGTILDTFNGSGSTGKAAMYENKEKNKGYKYIGIELTEEYLPISKARIEYVCNLIEEEKRQDKQMTIFDLGEENGK